MHKVGIERRTANSIRSRYSIEQVEHVKQTYQRQSQSAAAKGSPINNPAGYVIKLFSELFE
ncbi:MAG: hypothetical protein HQK57_02190 [Deltaproteobacteria bacterium]|nr:hypothetical protein [Deltaproteobacteria bacterium]